MDDNLNQTIARSGLSREHYLLTDWQTKRLANSYADLASSERYGLATTFFLSDIYGPTDFSKRDADGERIVVKMRSLLPKRAMAAIEDALHLNRLTLSLDKQLAEKLFHEMKVQEIDAFNYTEAYRLCDNFELRSQQIQLVHELGSELDVVVKKPIVQIALRLARGPAHLAGLGELQDFLERGVAAFLHMQGAEYFLDTVKARETELLTKIYAGEANPFPHFSY